MGEEGERDGAVGARRQGGRARRLRDDMTHCSRGWMASSCGRRGLWYEHTTGGRALESAAMVESIDDTDSVDPAVTVMKAARLAVYLREVHIWR